MACLVPVSASAQTPVGDAEGVIGPGVFTLFDRAFSAHGATADSRVAFVLEGFPEPQVHVLARLTHASLGTLPEPEGGFGWPFYVRLRNTERVGLFGTQGELVLLDSPPPELFGIPSPSYLRIYSYSYHPISGFQAQLEQSYILPLNTSPPDQPPNGIIFPSSFDFLPGGDIVLVDLFSLWVGQPNFTGWRMAWTSFDFGLEPYCSTVTVNGEEFPGFYLAVRDENWHKVRLPYQLAVPFPEPVLPAFKGVTYIDLTDEIAFLRVQSPGGIFTIGRTSLLDESVPPFTKPYGTLVAPEIGLSDLSGDLTYDHYHPDSEWVYWQRTASESGQDQCQGAHPYSEKWSPIYRISVLTGEVQLIAESWILYEFPTVLNTIEPLFGHADPFTYVLSSNVREDRWATPNVFVDETNFIPPTIVPIVLINAYGN